MSTNGGSNAGACAQAARRRRCQIGVQVANGAATPGNENYRAEQQFTAGWIALRFLREPAIALAHFARIAEGSANPITLARSFYWQGRAAEALGRGRKLAPTTKSRRDTRPPITASWRARDLASAR